ncbi:MAG: hypothetical protein JWO94_85 [Verrucomicrobiaceae bacterium]|nr:hypothetical protein [Verrucomicrobiaceae bacterium]
MCLPLRPRMRFLGRSSEEGGPRTAVITRSIMTTLQQQKGYIACFVSGDAMI